MRDQSLPASDRAEPGHGTEQITAGVTGHRPSGLAGADSEELLARVRDVLSSICRATQVERLMIASPLAEGADRVVARAALNAGHELRCVLPFARDDYLRDFANASSRSEYNALLSLASDIVELNGSNATPESRDAAYIAVGEWITAHSDVLIAIWDGGKARGNGGTGDVVRAALATDLPIIWIDSRPPHATSLLTESDGVMTEHSLDELGAIAAIRPHGT